VAHVAASEHTVEAPVRLRRRDPLGQGGRFWISFAFYWLLTCGWVGLLVAGKVPQEGPAYEESAAIFSQVLPILTFLLYLVLTFAYFRRDPPEVIRARVRARAARRRTGLARMLVFLRVLVVVYVVATGILVAAVLLPHAAEQAPHKVKLFKVLATGVVLLIWFVVQTSYAEYYANLYYRTGGGLDFAGEPMPDYFDFAYFSFSIGMTFGTTDVDVTSRTFRRRMLFHKLFSFGFNTAILALVFTVLFQ
jgi:uncharacterized membrane protein